MSEQTVTAGAARAAGPITSGAGPGSQARSAAAVSSAATAGPPAPVTVQDVLVEEVSIDGMCGVY